MCFKLAKEGASIAVAGNVLSDCHKTVASLKEVSGDHKASFYPIEVDVSNSGEVTSLFSSLASKYAGNI